MSGPAGSEDVAGAERDTGMLEKPAGRPGEIGDDRKSIGDYFFVEAEPSAIEPRQVSALRS